MIELTHYPRVGEPNPLIKLAIAPAKEGPVRWVDLSDYAGDDSFLITRVGFLPDGKHIYFFVQDRSQTWLDFCIAGVEGGKPSKVSARHHQSVGRSSRRPLSEGWQHPPN